MERLFHLVLPAPWERFVRDGHAAWQPPSLASEGFVHLSFAPQLSGTLAMHFARVDAVYLLEVDGTALGDALRVEPSRDDERFPHLYRALAREELIGAWHLGRDVRDGRWDVPHLGARSVDDRPPAAAPLVLQSP